MRVTTASEDALRALMERSLGGDAGAHEALLRALAPTLSAFFARRLFESAAECEDLVQETLIAIHTRRASYERGRPFMPWAYAIARYKLIDHLRRRGARGRSVELGEDMAATSFEAAASARLDVESLLAALPPAQAAAIRATKLRGESVAEAAGKEGMSEANVKVSVHRGLKTLAALVGRKG